MRGSAKRLFAIAAAVASVIVLSGAAAPLAAGAPAVPTPVTNSFSAGWNVYTGDFNADGKTDLFVYNPGSGANWTELANGSGGWTGVKGPSFSPGWNIYTGIYH
jgi:hypothetical protein